MPQTDLKEALRTRAPGSGPSSVNLDIDATQEYIAAGYQYGAWFGNYVHSLPQYVDDLTALLGADVYDRMLLDPQVSSSVATIVDSVLGDGMTLSPAVAADANGYALALEISDAANRMLDGLKTPLEPFQKDMLRAIPYGNRVAEKTYEVQGNRLNITKLKPKPRDVFAFVVDAYKNVMGAWVYMPGSYSVPWGDGYYGTSLQALKDATDEKSLRPFVQRNKLAVLTHAEIDSDPRGSSLLRAAYDAWYFKTQMLPEFWKYLTQFATPSLVGVMPDNSSVREYLRDTSGRQIPDGHGGFLTASTADTFMNMLLAFRNSSCLAVPFGSQVTPLQAAGNGEAHRFAFDWFDRQIATAIKGEYLSGMEGTHGATSAGAGVHQDTLGKRVQSNKRLLGSCMRRDVLTDWVVLNWGEEARALVPLVSLFPNEQQDIPAMWTAFATLVACGYLDPSQYAETDVYLNLPERSQESIRMLMEAKQTEADMSKAALKAAQNPPGPAQAEKGGGGAKFDGATFSGDSHWVTINGQHVEIGADGHPTDPKMRARLESGGGGKPSAKAKTGAGPEQKPTDAARSERAKQSATRIGSEEQRYSEEHNEPTLAAGVSGLSLRDNEPIDVMVVRGGVVHHGIELKTMVNNKMDKITMKASAMERKADWVQKNHAAFHTVVFDDRHVFNANGPGQHDDSKRQILYRRGTGSFRTGGMHKVADMAELNRLLDTPDHQLPAAAQPPKTYVPPSPRSK